MVGERSVPLLPGKPLAVSTPPPQPRWSGLILERHRVGAIEIPEHEHTTLCIHLQTSGPVEMDWNTNRRHGRLKTGSGNLMLLPPGTRDSLLWHGHSERILASIDPSVLRKAADELELKNVPEFCLSWSFEDEQLRLLLTEMEREATSGWATGPLYTDLLGLTLSVALLQKYGHEPRIETIYRGGLTRPALNRVLDFIAANQQSEIRLEDLAAVAGLSTFHFARAFRQSTGQTPHRYVLQRRLDHAKQLLRQPGWSMEAIASQAGFADASHFAKVFRRYEGLSPGEWQRQS